MRISNFLRLLVSRHRPTNTQHSAQQQMSAEIRRRLIVVRMEAADRHIQPHLGAPPASPAPHRSRIGPSFLRAAVMVMMVVGSRLNQDDYCSRAVNDTHDT